jgi:HSP20 family protein
MTMMMKKNGFYPLPIFTKMNENFYLDIEMPGVEDKDVHINIENSDMVITGIMSEEEEEGEIMVYSEYDDGSFHRHFTLADGVNTKKIKAKLNNGLLTVTLPKSEEYIVRKIPVKTK